MVLLYCSACKRQYEDRRFFWEEVGGSEGDDGEAFEKSDCDDVSESTNDGETPQTQGKAIAGDVVRGVGTCANLTGALAPAAHVVCGPFSAVAGAVGTYSGGCQLHNGLNTPSGIVDPHLVSKGGVTTAVWVALFGSFPAVPGRSRPPFFAVGVLTSC